MADRSTVISEFRRNAREVVRIAIAEYQGRPTISARVWFDAGDGTVRPGKAGLTLGAHHLPALAEGFRHALIEAKQRGLID